MESPIGLLIKHAEETAWRKTSGNHTATSSCGCLVEASWVSNNSRRIHIERCADHAIFRVAK